MQISEYPVYYTSGKSIVSGILTHWVFVSVATQIILIKMFLACVWIIPSRNFSLQFVVVVTCTETILGDVARARRIPKRGPTNHRDCRLVITCVTEWVVTVGVVIFKVSLFTTPLCQRLKLSPSSLHHPAQPVGVTNFNMYVVVYGVENDNVWLPPMSAASRLLISKSSALAVNEQVKSYDSNAYECIKVHYLK